MKGIVAKNCKGIVLKNNSFLNLDVAIELDNCENIYYDNNLISNNYEIQQRIQKLTDPNGKKIFVDIPLEYLIELFHKKNDDTKKSKLFTWLEDNGFTPSWWISEILDIIKTFAS